MADLIDRKALIDRINRMWESRQLTNTKRKTFLEILEAEPTVGTYSDPSDEYAKEWCSECNHIEVCQWYPYSGCEFRDREGNYAKGYNDAKREIALSGEYERVYQRGFEEGRKSEWTAVADMRGEE